MPSTAGESTGRALRDRPLGRLLILVVVLVAALLVAKTCGATRTDVSQEQAIAIARDAVDFEPTTTMVRLVKRGLQSRPFWAVSLSVREASGALSHVTVVVIDAKSGEIAEIRRSG